jgi:hypothetical protein
MFVQFLRERYPTSFEQVLQEILHGSSFARSFSVGFGRKVSDLWQEFRGSLLG